MKYILALSTPSYHREDGKNVYWPVGKRPYTTYANAAEAERARSNLQLFYMGKLYVVTEDQAFQPTTEATFDMFRSTASDLSADDPVGER